MATEANRAVQAAIDAAVRDRGEIGVQAAAYLGGQLVVDAWGGLADEMAARPVDGDTVFTVFSATKAVAATALHIQAERGLVFYDAPITRYWPQFGKHGKERATVRDALLHRVGIPQMPDGCTPEQMCDWDGMVRAMEDLKPLWEPGTHSGYHAYTFGWIVGEIVRRTDPQHRPFGKFVQDELCAPLKIDSLWLGIPDAVEPRVAKLTNTPPPPPEMAEQMMQMMATLMKAIPPTLGTTEEVFGRPDVRRSCHPGAGGIMNARSLARHYAMLANGGELEGVRLLSERRVAMLHTLYSDAPDQVIPQGYRRGLGYWLGGQEPMSGTMAPVGSNPNAFGHPGAGGSIGWADPDAKFAMAILHNKMGAPPTPEDNPLFAIAQAARKALGVAG